MNVYKILLFGALMFAFLPLVLVASRVEANKEMNIYDFAGITILLLSAVVLYKTYRSRTRMY